MVDQQLSVEAILICRAQLNINRTVHVDMNVIYKVLRFCCIVSFHVNCMDLSEILI